MNEKFKNLFLSTLNESDEGPIGDADEAFEKSLDKDTDKKDFDTEGMQSLVDSLVQELSADVHKIEKVIKFLVDPENPNSMLKRLEKVHKSIEFEKLFAPLEKSVEKASEALYMAIAKMNVCISTAGSRRDKRKQEDLSKQAQTTSPY